MTMSDKPLELDAYVEAAARLLYLPLEPQWMETIRANLEVTMAHARIVEEFTLPDEAEPAFVFEA